MGAERIAVLGGTFNPIHNAHLFLADAFYRALELNRVLVIPTGVPPHKAAPDLASGRDRLEMCRLAVQDRPYCQVSDMELAREGKATRWKRSGRCMKSTRKPGFILLWAPTCS